MKKKFWRRSESEKILKKSKSLKWENYEQRTEIEIGLNKKEKKFEMEMKWVSSSRSHLSLSTASILFFFISLKN